MVHFCTFVEVGLFMCGHVIITYHRHAFVLYLKDVQTNESIC